MIKSSTSKTFGKKIDKAKERLKERYKPKQTIEKRKEILTKLVNLDPDVETSFEDILKPEEAKAVEKIDDKTIFWAQIMRIILTYAKSNDLSFFVNSVEILEASLGDDISKQYKDEVKGLNRSRNVKYSNEVTNPDGTYENRYAVMNIEKKFWLDKYKTIINELTRKGLWSLKGH